MTCRRTEILKPITGKGSPRALRRGLIALFIWSEYSFGAGLGTIEIQSAMGQQLRASISLIGSDTKEQSANCVKAKIESLDGALAVVPKVSIAQVGQTGAIRLTTRENINEPALNIVVELGCEASVRRTYQVLLDPVLSLPTIQQNPQTVTPAATPLPSGANVTTPFAGDTNAPISTKRNKRNRSRAQDAGTDNALPPPKDSTSKDAPPKTAAKARRGSRSVLKMSLVDDPIEDAKIALRLKMSDTLTMPAAGLTQSAPGTSAEPVDPAAMAARTEELVKVSQALELARLKAEADALKKENKRITQEGLAEKNAVESMRGEMLTWIQVLGVILVVALIALGWLAWRLSIMHKERFRASWKELFTETSAADTDNNKDIDAETVFDDSLFIETNIVEPVVSPPASLSRDEAIDAGLASPAPVVLKKSPPVPSPRRKISPPPAPVEERKTPTPDRTVPLTKTAKQPSKLEEPLKWDGTPSDHTSPKVEEISDVMELVEVWMALHEPAKVLELLEPFSELDHPASPLPWLCLLDVYSSINDREKYEAILARIKTLFNVKLAPWDARAVQHQPRVLADFPHVVETILALWDSDEIEPYLDSLLIDDRDGVREGFDLPVYRDIARLTTLAKDPNRPRELDELKNNKAYAVLFAQPSPPVDATEGVKSHQQPKPALPMELTAKEKDAVAIPDSHERPKFLTPSFQPEVNATNDSINRPEITFDERTSGSDVVGFPETFSLEEPDIQRRSGIMASHDSDATVRGQAPVQSSGGTGTSSNMMPSAGSDFPYITQNELSAAGQKNALDAAGLDEPIDPWGPSKHHRPGRAAPPTPPTINKEMSPMAIKLHLAIAYQDIGDVEGACLLLNEVIAGGTADQCRQAKMLLAALT